MVTRATRPPRDGRCVAYRLHRLGQLTVVRAEGCTVKEYPAGSGLVDLGNGMVHLALDPGSTEMVLCATCLAVPKGQPTLTPAPNPGR